MAASNIPPFETRLNIAVGFNIIDAGHQATQGKRSPAAKGMRHRKGVVIDAGNPFVVGKSNLGFPIRQRDAGRVPNT
jgi:hypothetical protein